MKSQKSENPLFPQIVRKEIDLTSEIAEALKSDLVTESSKPQPDRKPEPVQAITMEDDDEQAEDVVASAEAEEVEQPAVAEAESTQGGDEPVISKSKLENLRKQVKPGEPGEEAPVRRYDFGSDDLGFKARSLHEKFKGGKATVADYARRVAEAETYIAELQNKLASAQQEVLAVIPSFDEQEARAKATAIARNKLGPNASPEDVADLAESYYAREYLKYQEFSGSKRKELDAALEKARKKQEEMAQLENARIRQKVQEVAKKAEGDKLVTHFALLYAERNPSAELSDVVAVASQEVGESVISYLERNPQVLSADQSRVETVASLVAENPPLLAKIIDIASKRYNGSTTKAASKSKQAARANATRSASQGSAGEEGEAEKVGPRPSIFYDGRYARRLVETRNSDRQLIEKALSDD